MIKHIILKLLIISLLIISVGCSNTSNKVVQKGIELQNIDFMNTIESTANRDKLPNTKSGGISTGLYNENGAIEKELHFNYDKSDSIKKYISIGNLIDADRVYKLILFVDYKQEVFKVDDRPAAIDFTFKLKAGETTEIPFELPKLETGIHDILFVIVKSPDNKSLDEEYRKRTDLNHLLFIRFSVSIESDTVKETVNYNEFGIIEKNDMLDGLFVSEKDNFKRWLTQKVKKNENINFYIRAGNNSNKETKEYAVINLFDWIQEDVVNDRKVIFLKVNNKEFAKVNSEFVVDVKEPGVYDLTTILVSNPYQKLDIYNRGAETGVRVGVTVE
ncbi:hypothetical protein [Paenibacillus montanisoli]|uniref:Uncharacterized protein n=1 Tax=Paenibacillus montanisoli TaxID=2081970 RepID=A0A328TV72_9BACL|nr:hypothetical protein [Paenibacillus montanisoli]RAP73502.1 hypothetical protein DL346_27160 [Paenibacillus montanisoli]